jgi:hypothetical protein
MRRDWNAGAGFQHPVGNARPLTKRKIAFAQLLMTAALVIGIIIATAVTVGFARADTFTSVAQGDDGVWAMVVIAALVLAGLGGIAATMRAGDPAR